MKGYTTATGGNANTKAAFKNLAPFTRSVTHINDEHFERAKKIGYDYAYVQFD